MIKAGGSSLKFFLTNRHGSAGDGKKFNVAKISEIVLYHCRAA
jgi:hypothetical protein